MPEHGYLQQSDFCNTLCFSGGICVIGGDNACDRPDGFPSSSHTDVTLAVVITSQQRNTPAGCDSMKIHFIVPNED